MGLSNRKYRLALFALMVVFIGLSQILWLYTERKRDLHTLSDDQFIAYLDARIPELIEDYSIPGAGILLIKGGRELWSNAYGYANQENGVGLTTNSSMLLMSVSKSVSAWGIMKLVQEGKITLDDSVGKYFPSWRSQNSQRSYRDATIRELLSHSAGISDPTYPVFKMLPTENIQLAWEPGSTFAYSNIGFLLLERLVEKVSGRNFQEYMDEQVLNPLGMRTARFGWHKELESTAAVGYNQRGKPVPPDRDNFGGVAAGGLFASLPEVGRFVAAGMLLPQSDSARPVLTRASIEELYKPQIAIPGLFGLVGNIYGLGHFIETLPNGQTAVWHGGHAIGWMTHFHSVPQSGDGIVILTNGQRCWPLFTRIVDDWSRWRGFGSVKLRLIHSLQAVVRTIIGWFLLVLLWSTWRIYQGVKTGTRRPTLRGGIASWARIAMVTISLALLGMLWWYANLPYLFMLSMFPKESVWLAASLVLLSLQLLAAALLPVVRRER